MKLILNIISIFTIFFTSWLPGFARASPSLLLPPHSLLLCTLPPSEFFLSIFSTVHEIYRTFEILTPNPPPPGTPGVGWVGLKRPNVIDCLDSSWHFPDFWFFDPLKFPLRPPPLGGEVIFLGRNHPQICRDLCILNPFSDLFFAFKDTISRHFAGYASVALETIWLHEPRDLIFLGPLTVILPAMHQ